MSAPELIAGSVVAGKYTIRSILLHGGATATYRAGAKNREVALKVYDPAILKLPDVLKALALHQSVSAKLTSRDVVRIADSGTESNFGAPFTVTDFESGPSLAQLIDRGPLSASDSAAMVRNLARATDLLHSNGVDSLSLHPSNVFVSAAPPYETRIADFGASLVRRALPVSEKAGRWMPWLAPEQIKGQVAPGPAADIFALGLLAFFAVTGKLYWRAGQVKALDLAALRREILAERMPASVRAGEFSINLNPAVDAVFARALGFRPADRYATAREFAVALDAALTGRTVAEADAAEPQSAAADDATGARRNAPPPPRKMPQRATMLGMGSPPPDTSNLVPAARPPMGTMMGIGTTEAKAAPPPPKPAAPAPATAPTNVSTAAKIATPAIPTPATKATMLGIPGPAAKLATPAMPTAPPKVAPPPMPAQPAMPTQSLKATALGMPSPATRIATPAVPMAPPKIAPPPMPTSPAKAAAPATPAATAVFTSPAAAVPYAKPPTPAMPVAPAMSAEPPMVVPPGTSTERRGPPGLPMAPPPAQLADALARFEAPSPSTVTAFSASPVTNTDVVQASPVWPTTEPSALAGEQVETGVAVIGANFTDTPKSTRLRWIAAACGLLILTGGGAWALTGRNASSSRVASLPSANATVPSPARNAEPERAEETRPAAALEPAAPAPPAAPEVPVAIAEPAAPPPPAEEPPAPAVDSNAAEQAPAAPAPGPRPPAPKKNCGKFLKRCK